MHALHKVLQAFASPQSFRLAMPDVWAGFQVNLKLIWNSVVIESNAVSNSDKAEAMIGCFKMFEQITKILQTTVRNKDPKKFLHGHFLS